MKHIKELHIFDFDGTLCKSPENTDENKALWESKTGGLWGRKKDGSYKTGWWSKPETLDPDVFDIELVDFVKEEAIKSIGDIEAFTVLMTGRIPVCSKNVKEILRRNGVPYFNRYLFCDMYGTQKFKVRNMKSMMDEMENLEKVVMWEDRMEHIDEWKEDVPPFREVGKEWAEKTGGEFVLKIISKDYKLVE